MIGCTYRNGSDRMVIVRCVGPEEFFLERVVFPFELLSFACPPASHVEIWSHGLGGAELVETIDAGELCSDEAGGNGEPALQAVEGLAGIGESPWLEAG